MKTETMNYLQLLAWWLIALSLVSLNILVLYFGWEYLPEFLRVLKAIGSGV